ncbi:hypothetical protein EIN_096030 [Entamoeba invadens IP1]|uniref:Ras guanine nucleotide exchange factor glfB-like C-terminal domain-containing protein n=1 Tax=Entamoeba invadens IP1 TaxID=370355 RepID=A0A0A1U688_ENTIV|nr:hypothetical protein EIN_096030 [Entamoeba invadens IP1]ELP87346.1 hypothetical protein EIN_096030 [Entamoeba invadens IP1]|eukprot:XP_004254117.1 hypothetical protein EIN_096030 [Entamoeba invadens IP1]
MELVIVLLAQLLFIAVVFGTALAVACAFRAQKKKKDQQYSKVEQNNYNQVPELSFPKMVNRMTALYHKPLSQSSIGIDIPRLVPKLIFVSEDGIDRKELISGANLYKDDDQYAMERTLEKVVSEMILQFDGKKLVEKFRKEFEAQFVYIKKGGNGDCGTFFTKLLPKVFPEDSLTLMVMKTFTQALFASAVEFLLPLRLSHGYHDGFSGWRILLINTPTEVIVRHVKGEKSYKSDGFTFEWSLVYIINKKTREISNVKINIFNVDFINYPLENQKGFNSMIDNINRTAQF